MAKSALSAVQEQPIQIMKMGKGSRPDTSAGDLARGSNVKLFCDDCLHYRGTAHPSYGKPCAELGINAKASAPPCYTANVGVFRDQNPDALNQFFGMLACLSPKQRRVLMGMIRNADGLRRTGFQFMSTVYFALGDKGRVSLSDYYRGWVTATGPMNTVQVVGHGYLTGKKNACTAMLDRSSLMTWEQFLKEKKQLIASGRLTGLTPRQQQQAPKDGYEPPTIDTAGDVLARRAQKVGKAIKDEVAKGQRNAFRVDQDEFESNAEAEDGDEDTGDNL